MKTDRYGHRPTINVGAERFMIPTAVVDLATGKTLNFYPTKTRAVKVVKAMNRALREDE